MMRLAFAVVLGFATVTATAQSVRRQDGGRDRQMSQEERQRMRDDMREAYRHRQDRPNKAAGQQQARPQQMSPEERGRLRRDIEDANRDLKR